jgi:hypothetical protein
VEAHRLAPGGVPRDADTTLHAEYSAGVPQQQSSDDPAFHMLSAGVPARLDGPTAAACMPEQRMPQLRMSELEAVGIRAAVLQSLTLPSNDEELQDMAAPQQTLMRTLFLGKDPTVRICHAGTCNTPGCESAMLVPPLATPFWNPHYETTEPNPVCCDMAQRICSMKQPSLGIARSKPESDKCFCGGLPHRHSLSICTDYIQPDVWATSKCASASCIPFFRSSAHT